MKRRFTINPSQPKPSVWWLALNIGAFQLCWFSLVLLGDLVVPWVIGWLVSHWYLSDRAAVDKWLMAQFVGLGLIFELIHQYSGLLQFEHHLGPLPPLWLIVLWPLFSTLLLHSLSWLLTRPLLGMGLIALGGWASYWAGAALSGGLLNTWGSLLLALEWAFIYWLCINELIPRAVKLASR